MDKDVEQLKELASTFRLLTGKIILIRLMNQAKAEYDKCNFENCRRLLIEAYLKDKKNSAILRGLGCIKQFDGKWNSAIRYFNMALKYSKKQEVEYTLLGMAYYLQDKLDRAITYFNLAIDKNDNYIPAYDKRNQAMLENHLKIIDLQESLKKYL